MYIINKKTNKLTKVEETTFKNEGFRERKHLQEWIAENPEVLGEELLIIQKEFAGFEETKERLDLLALDKKGNLVVIENKSDDSGRDVVWQVLKYASYCSQLTASDIKRIFSEYLSALGIEDDPEDRLLEFFGGDEDYQDKLNKNQRIVMISGDFRKEVTSTALWLLQTYNLRIQCLRVSIAKLREDLIFDIEQIIPTKDAADYQIKIAQKKQEEAQQEEEVANRHKQRMAFWTQFIAEMNKHNNLCMNVSPTKEMWIPIAMGFSGVQINVDATSKYVACKINIHRNSQEQNKEAFDYLYAIKDEIEKSFGGYLNWQRKDDAVMSTIAFRKDGLNAYDDQDWPEINVFLVDAISRMEKAFKKPIADLKAHVSK